MEIIDDVNKTLKDNMMTTLCFGSMGAIAVSCFSMYPFQELKERLLDIFKLPCKLKIPAPVGYYPSDWAIVFEEGTVRHVSFLVEVKGLLDKMELRGVENEDLYSI